MNESKISVRYAKALFQLAKEKAVDERIFEDVSVLMIATDTIVQFNHFLDSPVIKNSKKKEILSGIFKNSFHEITINFLNLLVDKNRDSFLAAISRNFISFYKKDRNIKTATITTYNKLSDQLANKIKSSVKEAFKSEVDLHNKINPAIIGGYILRIDDLQYDNSVKTKLNTVKKDLIYKSIND